ncbi:MAG: hypothetical protein MZW92_76605 [Comamonadaceae bacterium]|nr:hypothetical protein [Comamonadaceae bacterium]
MLATDLEIADHAPRPTRSRRRGRRHHRRRAQAAGHPARAAGWRRGQPDARRTSACMVTRRQEHASTCRRCPRRTSRAWPTGARARRRCSAAAEARSSACWRWSSSPWRSRTSATT